MAVTVFSPVGVLPAAPRLKGRFFRLISSIARPFLVMSVSGALKSANALEMALPCPAGEDNWKSRSSFCGLLADAIERSPDDMPAGFASSIDPLWSNILDAATSERTTLSIQACKLLGVLPRALRQQYHSHIDRVLPALIRQAASTKAVAQKAASAAISNIIVYSGFHVRILYHVCQTFDDKYSAPKLYAPSWLKLIIENYHPALHPDRDYDQITRAISLGLEEADNNVRVNSRATFWAYYKIDQAGAEEIMAKLNNHAKTALINDPNNPDKPSKSKTKKAAEGAQALAEIRQQAKERMKQRTVTTERNRVVSARTITSEDFPFGPLNMGDEKPAPKLHPATVAPEMPPAKTTSRPIAVHKKGSSHDGHVATKKPSAMDVAAVDGLRNSQNKKPTTTEPARPFLSAPVRRPRIVATPINIPQSSSRPSSRTGMPQPAELPLRSVVSHKELKSAASEVKAESHNVVKPKKIQRSEITSPVLIPDGKENANIYNTTKRIDRTSPERIITPINRDPGPIHPPKHIIPADDGLTREQRLKRQELDKEITVMAPQMPFMVPVLEHQPDAEKNTQMYHAYPALNHDGQVEDARRALEKALEYLNKDALDVMGFRKLRKLLETFGGYLIADQALYDLLWAELLPRLGTFEELLTQPLHEISNENHPRYVRQAILVMVAILIQEYPHEWSYQYHGPALASCMIARCAYSANCEPHEGAPYVKTLAIVNQINTTTMCIVETCLDPIMTLDSVLGMLSASEEFLMRHAPLDSESQQSWASFNPYSKINRLRTENESGIFHLFPKNLDTLNSVDPKPLPMKLPLLMETGLRLIKLLIQRGAQENFKLGTDREDVLADLARHLMSSYNIIIRRQVMEYCQVLYRNFASEERFWTHFPAETERNLLHYYLEKVR